MKLECHVIEVADCGDILRVKMQGGNPAGADWRPIEIQEVRIASSRRAGQTYYVGRKVMITIEPA